MLFFNDLPSQLNCGEDGYDLKNNLLKCKGLEVSNLVKISEMRKKGSNDADCLMDVGAESP